MPIRSVCSRSLCFAVLAVASSIATGQSAVVTPYTSEQAFIAAAGGMVRQVDLEDVAAGTTGAFQSRGSNASSCALPGALPQRSAARTAVLPTRHRPDNPLLCVPRNIRTSARNNRHSGRTLR